MNKTIIVIPTLNEYENVKILLNEFLKLDVDVIFIDDNSSDLTYKLIEDNNLYRKKYFLIKRSSKQGYASACILGMIFAINEDYETLVQMDADLSHSVKDLKKLLESKKYSDVVIGSRYVANGKIEGWGFFRTYLSLFANKTCKTLLKTDINDFTSGFRVYDVSVLKVINFEQIKAEGYSFLVEIINKISLKKYSILEVPILFNDRKYGSSKLDTKVIFESIFNLIKMSREIKK
jgi:dolichol-phosphate mannosyltransferase